MRLPDRVFARALAGRAVMVWVIMRALTLFVPLRPAALVFLLGVVVITVLLDARARSEDLFLADLGVSRGGVAVVPAATVVALEVGLAGLRAGGPW